MAAEYTERMCCEFEVPKQAAEMIAFQEAIRALRRSGDVRFSGIVYGDGGHLYKYTATDDAIESMRSLLASLGCTRKP